MTIPAERETVEQAAEEWVRREGGLADKDWSVDIQAAFLAGAAWQLAEVERILDAQIEDVENGDALYELRWLRDRLRRKP